MTDTPLVSVIIPTHDRPHLLQTRSIPSVMAQIHTNWELHVVGDDAIQGTYEAVASFNDPRLRFTNIPRQGYPDGDYQRWMTSGSEAVNYGLDTVQGEWVCWLGDDDEFEPNYIERLLQVAQEEGLDAVYGRSAIINPEGEITGYLGVWPPQMGQQTCDILMRKNDVRIDPQCWQRWMPNDFDFLSRLFATGIRYGFVPEVLFRYWPSTHMPKGTSE